MGFGRQIGALSRLTSLVKQLQVTVSDALPPLDKMFPGEAEKAAADGKGDLPLPPESPRVPLRGLSSGAQNVIAEIEKSHEKLSKTVDKADEKLNHLIEVLSGRQAFGALIGIDLGELLEQLFEAVAFQRDLARHPAFRNPAELERSIRLILDVIRVGGGPEGQEFFHLFQQILGSLKKPIPKLPGKSSGGSSISSAQSMGGLP